MSPLYSDKKLDKQYFKNLIPELVEKKEPPIITKIRKINDKLLELSSSESPILETLLVRDKNTPLKLLSKLKKTKNILIKNKK